MTRTVLVADGDPVTRRILRQALVAEGFTHVSAVRRGADVARRVRQDRPDLVLLGGGLADPDAQMICQELKLDRRTNLVPVVLTAAAADPSVPGGLRVAANGQLRRPFTAVEVGAVVREALHWRESLGPEGIDSEITFQLRSEMGPLEELTRILVGFGGQSGLSSTQAKHLAMAVREIGMNAIEWGHAYAADRVVTVVYRGEAERVTVVVRDMGPGFDPANLPHAARIDDPVSHLSVRDRLGLRDGGFGLLIARGLVDELNFNATGNEARLVKLVRGASAEWARREQAAS